MTDLLSETPAFEEYPRNEVDVQLQSGENRRLYFDNRAVSEASEAGEVIEEAVKSYVSDHDEAVGAIIYRVEKPGDRAMQKSI